MLAEALPGPSSAIGGSLYIYRFRFRFLYILVSIGDRWATALPGMYLYHYDLVSLMKRSFYADAAADLVQMRRLGQVVVSISIFDPGTVLNTTAAAMGNPGRRAGN